MAENTQVINIESKYKDKGLAELKKVLAGTQLAMNNLSKAGKESSDSFIKLQARTVALNAKIAALTKPIADVSKATKQAGTGSEQLSTKVKGLKDSFGSLQTVLKAGIIAGLGKFIGDTMRTGAELEVLRSSFAGTTKDMELFRTATAGTVTEGGLIQLSNYASDLGVSLKDQALLFSLAEDAADKYGGTVPENFERVINATDGTAKGLRAVGISTKQFADELDRLLPKSAKTIDDLGAEEQQAIRLRAILNLTGVTIEGLTGKQKDMADQLESLDVIVKDFIANMGVGMVRSLNNYLKVIGDVGEATGIFNSNLITLKDIAEIVGMSLIQSPIITFFQIMRAEIGFTIDKFNEFTGLKLFQDSARGGNFTGNQGADFENIILDEFGKPNFRPSDYIAEHGVKTKKTTGSSSNSGSNKLKDKVEKTALELLVEAVNDIQNDKKFQNFMFDNLKVSSEIGTVDPLNGGGIDLVNKLLGKSGIEEITSSFNLDETLGTAEDISTQIQSLFGLLGAGTDTFIGKMLGFFNTITSILQAFSLVKSIIGLFGTLVGGGAGKALSMPSGSGGGNVYLGLDLNTMQVYKQGRQQYMQRQNQIRIN